MTKLTDPFNREIRYLRVSVTDRCNYRCFYCMPETGVDWDAKSEFLSYEEMARIIRLFAELGVDKVRFTGGEPLVRKGLPEFIRDQIKPIPGLKDLSISTNAHLLDEYAQTLVEAGVTRVNISLDSLRQDRFLKVTRNGDLAAVLRGIDAGIVAGMSPIKINMVVMKGLNDDEIDDMLEFALQKGIDLRFIETMPIGSAGMEGTNYYMPADEILSRLQTNLGQQLIPAKGMKGAGPARYYQIGAGPSRVGVISAMSRHFCEGCNRVRLTAKGDLVLCLGQENRVSLRESLRQGLNDNEMKTVIRDAIATKPYSHEFNNSEQRVPLRHMSSLGG